LLNTTFDRNEHGHAHTFHMEIKINNPCSKTYNEILVAHVV
jgi:hypothetical protein